MKVLYWLGIGFDRHGPSVHLLQAMIEETLIAGHEVVAIVRNTGGEDPDVPANIKKYDKFKCEIIYDKVQEKGKLVARYFEDIAYFFRCKKILKQHADADVVFLQSCTAPIFPIALAKKIIKKPILFNVQNIFPNDALVLGKLSRRGVKGIAYFVFEKMQRCAYKKADCLVTISEDMRNTLLKEKASDDKIHVILNWSYDDNARDIPNDDNLFLRDHPEARDKFRVVFAGNLGAMVNAKIIADAAELLKEYSDIQFLIIGGGNNMNLLKALAAEKHLSNMLFYPYQPEEYARHNYAMADVNINALPDGIIYTCMPSKTATMLNSAKPMIVAVEKESEYAKMLSQVDKCIIVDNNDAEGFSQGILEIYNMGKNQFSFNSRDVFKEYCSRDNAKRYVEVLEHIAANCK